MDSLTNLLLDLASFDPGHDERARAFFTGDDLIEMDMGELLSEQAALRTREGLLRLVSLLEPRTPSKCYENPILVRRLEAVGDELRRRALERRR